MSYILQMISSKPNMYHHRIQNMSRTTLKWSFVQHQWKHPTTIHLAYPIHTVFLTSNRKCIVINNQYIYTISSRKSITSPTRITKAGRCVIEYDTSSDTSYISGDSFSFQSNGRSSYNLGHLLIDGHRYNDDITYVNDLHYMPFIGMYMLLYDDCFGIMSPDVYRMQLSKRDIIKNIDSEIITDSCVFHCDNMVFAVSTDQTYVVYVSNNSLYVGETVFPFRLYTCPGMYYIRISCIDIQDDTIIVSHDNMITMYNIK
jgi:hypothetical protein